MVAERLFQPHIWDLSKSFRYLLAALRLAELVFIAIRLLAFRAPLVILWTRIPILKSIGPPYKELGEILAPKQGRAPFVVHETVGEISLGDVKSKDELIQFMREARDRATKPRSTREQLLGGIVHCLLQEWGLCYMKIGVILSMRTDVPTCIREELRTFHDDLPPLSEKWAKAAIERELLELRQDSQDLFEWIELKPLASATFAQVHRAKFRNGPTVALKIQKPNVFAMATLDTWLISNVFSPFLWKVFHGTRKMDPHSIADALETLMLKECDFYAEALCQEEFARQCREDKLYSKSLKIAHVYAHLCTKKLIIMELVEGTYPLDQLDKVNPDKLWDALTTKFPEYPEDSPVHLFKAMCSFWGDMILNWQSVHADPQLGNMHLMEPQGGHGWRIFICDFGMSLAFAYPLKRWLRDWFRGVMWLRDDEEFIRVTMRYIEPPEILKDVRPHFPRLVNARYSQKISDEMMTIIFATEAEMHSTAPKWFLRKYWSRRTTNTKDGSEMPFIMSLRPAAGKTTADEALELMQRFSIGFKADRVLNHGQWTVFKTTMQLEGIIYTLWRGASWNDIFMRALVRSMKEEVQVDLEKKNADTVRDYLSEVQTMLDRPRKQFKFGRPPVQ